MTKNLLLAGLLLSVAAGTNLHAEEKSVQTFNSGSYQQILRENADQPFILSVWSVDCPSCLKDMETIKQVQQNHPRLKIVMLSTDEPEAATEVKSILARYQLAGLDNWMFGNEDPQKLRYEIDPGWYGELPRTYFFTSSHARVGKSGALSMNEFETQIDKLKP